jgi:SOS-response transcriptional repressor LexA
MAKTDPKLIHREQGRRLMLARERKGLATAADAAKFLHLPSATTYQHHENGTRGITRAVKIYAKGFEVPEEWLLYGRNPPVWAASDFVDSGSATRAMPIISTVAAGQLLDPSTQIEGEHQIIEIGGLPPGDYFATRVQGTSMNRISPPGSLIVVDRADRELVRGRRYIFSRRGETTFKRYETSPLRLEPETTEPETNPIIFPRDEEEWTVIGRVRVTLLDNL